MYKVWLDHFTGDEHVETLGTLSAAIAFAKSEKGRRGGYWYVTDKAKKQEFWNSND